jgi:hypothetical protein
LFEFIDFDEDVFQFFDKEDEHNEDIYDDGHIYDLIYLFF